MTMTYEEHMDACTAVDEGRATDLVRCYLCYLHQTGRPDMSPNADQGPLRGVLGHFTTNTRQDPTDAVILTCGHSII